MFHDFSIFSCFLDQRFTAQLVIHKPWFQLATPHRFPPWLAPLDVARPLLPHKDIIPIFPPFGPEPSQSLTVQGRKKGSVQGSMIFQSLVASAINVQRHNRPPKAMVPIAPSRFAGRCRPASVAPVGSCGAVSSAQGTLFQFSHPLGRSPRSR
jgi:hypothetical protein